MKCVLWCYTCIFFWYGFVFSDTIQHVNELNERCQELDLALSFTYDELSGKPIPHVAFRMFSSSIESLEGVALNFLNNDPYREKTALVRTYTKNSLCKEEIDSLNKRDAWVRKNLKNLLGKSLEGKKIPRIGLCLSGGGVRALVASAGFIKGLDDNGCVEIISYISALSGSTWMLAPWMQSANSFSEFYSQIMYRVAHGMMHKTPSQMAKDLLSSLPILTEYFLKKLLYKQTPSLIDFYGYLLALNYASVKNQEHYSTINITGQQKSVVDGMLPFPLYSAIVPKYGDGYIWQTFSPYEVSSHNLQAAIPVWAYGRSFKKGVSVNMAPPMSLGLLMGIWGSACSISFKEVYDMILEKLEPKSLFAPLKFVADETVIGDTRVFPAYVPNYTYGQKDLPISSEKECITLDAGICCNIPVPPLLNVDRGIDIIIIVDASGDIIGAPELKIAEAYAKKHKMPFPKIDYSAISKQTYSIFDDGINSPAPIVIYVPMIKNKNYSSKFDPQDHLGVTGFMNTFNFKYSEEEANILAGLFTQAAYELRKDLIKTIITVLNRKNT